MQRGYKIETRRESNQRLGNRLPSACMGLAGIFARLKFLYF